jgi:ferredoxin
MDYGPDRVLRLLQLGQWERVLTSRDVWLCLGCDMCGAHCSNGINVGDAMILLREVAAAQGYRSEEGDRLRERLRNQLHATRRGNQPIASHEPAPPELDDRLCAGIQRLNQLSQTVAAAHNVSSDDNDDRLIWSQNLAHIPDGLRRKIAADLVYFVGCVGAFFPRSYRVPRALTRSWRLPGPTSRPWEARSGAAATPSSLSETRSSPRSSPVTTRPGWRPT